MHLRKRRPPCPASHDAWGALAEQIDARVRAQIAAGVYDVDVVEAVVQELEPKHRDALLREAFGKLDPTTRWEKLAAYFDDDSIRRALKDEHDLVAAETDPAAYAQVLAHTTRRTGVLYLGQVHRRMRLWVNLYESDQISDKSDAEILALEPARSMELILEDADSWYWRVLKRTYDAKTYGLARYLPDEHSFIFMGTPDSKSSGLINVLYRGSRMWYSQEGGRYTMDRKRRDTDEYVELVLGRCQLNGVEMFQDPDTKADSPPTD